MTIYTHKHHIIPRHMGGSDDPSNLVELTVEEHAQAHLELYEKYGNPYDEIAYRMLKGQIKSDEARRLAASHANQWENKSDAGRQACYDNLKLATEKNIGTPRKESTKKKIAEKNKEYWSKQKHRPWQFKLYIIEGKEYRGIQAIADDYGCTVTTVFNRINNPKWDWKKYE